MQLPAAPPRGHPARAAGAPPFFLLLLTIHIPRPPTFRLPPLPDCPSSPSKKPSIPFQSTSPGIHHPASTDRMEGRRMSRAKPAPPATAERCGKAAPGLPLGTRRVALMHSGLCRVVKVGSNSTVVPWSFSMPRLQHEKSGKGKGRANRTGTRFPPAPTGSPPRPAPRQGGRWFSSVLSYTPPSAQPPPPGNANAPPVNPTARHVASRPDHGEGEASASCVAILLSMAEIALPISSFTRLFASRPCTCSRTSKARWPPLWPR